MRVAILCVVVLSCLCAVQAKLVSVSGQGVIIHPNQFPANFNLTDRGPDDSSSFFKNGALAVTAFDELQGVKPPQNIVISKDPVTNATITLSKNVAYDSFFMYFHQKTPSNDAQSASASFVVDNRVVGCTQTIFDEFQTTPIWGLTPSSLVWYPTQSSQVNAAGRAYESTDTNHGSGTVFNSINSIGQPGDYTRCFSASCVDTSGGECDCSASLNQCIISNPNLYKCFSSASELASLSGFHFSSSCLVDVSSVVIEVASCSAANGCIQNGNQICIRGAQSSVDLRVTAGCNCDKTITATFTPQTTGNCLVPDTPFGTPTCGAGANTLTVSTSCSQAHASSINTGVGLEFSDAAVGCGN